MTDSSQEDEMKLREYQLKLVQAWAELKNKIATMMALANVGLLATVVAFMKDKGPDSPSLFALGSGSFGLMSSGIALLMVWASSETAINRIITNDKPEEHIKNLANKVVTNLFALFIMGGAIGFIGSVAMFTGYSQAIFECGQKDNPCHFKK
jgi:hypothetical protein